ncbi:unnamed protein product, partial [Prorocentrum cordatum]
MERGAEHSIRSFSITLECRSGLSHGNCRRMQRQPVAAGVGATRRDARGEAGGRLSYSAGISACEKGEQWQQSLALLCDMRETKLEFDGISCTAVISACEKGEQWQRALALLREMWETKLVPNVIFSYSAGISACEKGEQWQRALALLSEMQEAKLEPDVISTTML